MFIRNKINNSKSWCKILYNEMLSHSLWQSLQFAYNLGTYGRSLLDGGPCSMAVPAMITRPRTSALRMPSTHPAIRIQNPFLTAQSTQIKSVISVPIKDFIHHYPRALFNDIPRVGAHFYDIPGSGCTFTTYPGRGAV